MVQKIGLTRTANEKDFLLGKGEKMFLIRAKKITCLAVSICIILAFAVFQSGNRSESLYTDADVNVPEENITRSLIVNSKDSPNKTAYLTFDDGPTNNTEIILDTLKEHDIKATFFVLGEKAEQNPEILTRVFNEGHTIGNHSYSHDYNGIYGSREEFMRELLKWEEVVGSIIGRENLIRLFRFPGGSKDEWKYMYRNIAAEMGYKYVDWTALCGDADGKPFSKERCMEEIKKYCTDTGDVVILMHDSAKKTITAETLPQIIDFLKSQGYSFKRIEI